MKRERGSLKSRPGRDSHKFDGQNQAKTLYWVGSFLKALPESHSLSGCVLPHYLMAAAGAPLAKRGSVRLQDGPIEDPDLMDVAGEAVWSLSGAKPGSGIEQLLEDDLDTFWQSDGTQPHLVDIQFLKRQSIVEVAMFLDHARDDSYTPKKVWALLNGCPSGGDSFISSSSAALPEGRYCSSRSS
jgi:hypothetical protein